MKSYRCAVERVFVQYTKPMDTSPLRSGVDTEVLSQHLDHGLVFHGFVFDL